MIFNSIDFAVFLPVVFAIYWITGRYLNRSAQNIVIVIASYVFYGWWDWRFLTLLFFSSILDFFIGLRLSSEQNNRLRKLLLLASITINLGLLVFFKYFNFFLDSLNNAFTFFGSPINFDTMAIILPVGISFYTFQTLSYSIDVYHRRMEGGKDPVAFLAYVSFFPQLVAGPIERATNLLPQFNSKIKQHFNYELSRQGMRQILWGLFKKMVIADNCAVIVNEVFSNSSDLNGSTLLIGAIFFAFQIYGDFSGYSDIAIGVSKLFGFTLMKNFAFPYFSRDMAEFWRRWHISLSTWFRDYVYFPLGGSRHKAIRNTFIIFLLSGFWHGANWTFIAWGLINALYFLPLLLLGNNRNNLEIVARGKIFPTIKEASMILITFLLTVIAWIFFRAETLTQAFDFIGEMFSPSLFLIPVFSNPVSVALCGGLILLLVSIEWLGRMNEYALENIHARFNKPVRWVIYSILVFIIGMYSSTEETPFIYFQF